MKQEHLHNSEDILRDKLKGHQFDFNQEAWQRMQSLLNEEEDKRRRSAAWLWKYALPSVLLVAVCITGWYNWQKQKADDTTALLNIAASHSNNTTSLPPALPVQVSSAVTTPPTTTITNKKNNAAPNKRIAKPTTPQQAIEKPVQPTPAIPILPTVNPLLQQPVKHYYEFQTLPSVPAKVKPTAPLIYAFEPITIKPTNTLCISHKPIWGVEAGFTMHTDQISYQTQHGISKPDPIGAELSKRAAIGVAMAVPITRKLRLEAEFILARITGYNIHGEQNSKLDTNSLVVVDPHNYSVNVTRKNNDCITKSMHFVQMPVTANVKLGKKCHIFAGLVPSLMVFTEKQRRVSEQDYQVSYTNATLAKVQNSDVQLKSSDSFYDADPKNCRRVDVGLVAGVTLDITHRLSLNMRYNHGLAMINDNGIESQPSYNRNLQMMMRYTF